MALVKVKDGNWIDPKTIAAVRLAGDGSASLVVDRYRSLHSLIITFDTIDLAKACCDELAGARNNACPNNDAKLDCLAAMS